MTRVVKGREEKKRESVRERDVNALFVYVKNRFHSREFTESAAPIALNFHDGPFDEFGS